MSIRHFLNITLCLGLAGVLQFFAPKADAGDTAVLFVPHNRSELLTLPETMSKVVITDREVAGVVKHRGKKVAIIGNRLGHTDVRFMNSGGRIIRHINVVVTPDLPAIRKALNTFLPHENIGIELVNRSVALTGVVSDAEVAHRAVKIVDEFIKNNASENDKSSALNLMQIRSGQQVMLRVRVGEIQRTALKNIGFSLQGSRITSEVIAPFATGGAVGSAFGEVVAGADSFGIASIIHDTANLELSATLDLLERDGLFKVLAEPNLVAISGESAEFLAGGEFPIPIAQGDETISIDYKPFGVAVDFTPAVLSQNRIRLVVEPEVSEITTEAEVELSGFSVPSVSTRRAKTTVELAPGESFMIAGLIKDEMIQTINEIPGLSEVPILSALFRSTAFQRNETELVIAVTPYLVDPMVSGDVRLPTDDIQAPSVLDSLFFGAIAQRTSSNVTSGTKHLEGPIGFVVD